MATIIIVLMRTADKCVRLGSKNWRTAEWAAVNQWTDSAWWGLYFTHTEMSVKQTGRTAFSVAATSTAIMWRSHVAVDRPTSAQLIVSVCHCCSTSCACHCRLDVFTASVVLDVPVLMWRRLWLRLKLICLQIPVFSFWASYDFLFKFLLMLLRYFCFYYHHLNGTLFKFLIGIVYPACCQQSFCQPKLY